MNSTTISALKIFPDQFEQFFNEIPKRKWHWVPKSWEGIPSEPFTAIEQICHIRDVEIDGYHVRFHRLLTEIDPILDSLDGHGLVQQKDYAKADPKLVFKEIRAARAKTLHLIGKLTQAQFERSGYFEGYGRLTVTGLIHYLCSHDQQHLSGLQWLLGKIESDVRRAD